MKGSPVVYSPDHSFAHYSAGFSEFILKHQAMLLARGFGKEDEKEFE